MFARVFVAVALIALPSAWCYSAGAPSQACGDMVPQHHTAPQSSPAPYQLDLSKNQFKSGDVIDLELKGLSDSDTIKGFLVQARVDDKPVGQFLISPDNKYAQVLSCLGGTSNAVTHKKIFGNSLQSVKFSWKAPQDLTKPVDFYATVALNGGIFWVGKIVQRATFSSN